MSRNKDNTSTGAKEIDLSQKEVLLMRLSNHIEQAQIDSPAYFLSNLAVKGNEEFVNEFLGDQPFMDTSTLENFMQSQLYISSFWGLYDIVKILLDNKADPNFKNQTTLWTPLHAATFQDHGRVVMLLLENGADPMSPDSKGRTPVDFASASDKIWSHFDIQNIPRSTVPQLIKRGILRGTQATTPSSATSQNNTTDSGIKLASYQSSPSCRSTSKNDTIYNSRSTSRYPSEQNNPISPSPYPSSLTESNTQSSSRTENKSTFTPLSSRSRNSVSDSSQMKEIFGNGIIGGSSVTSSNSSSRRSSQSYRTSGTMSSILSWE